MINWAHREKVGSARSRYIIGDYIVLLMEILNLSWNSMNFNIVGPRNPEKSALNPIKLRSSGRKRSGLFHWKACNFLNSSVILEEEKRKKRRKFLASNSKISNFPVGTNHRWRPINRDEIPSTYTVSWRDLIPALNFVWMIVGPVMRPTDTPSIDSRKACRKRGVSWWACRGFVSKVEAFVRGRGAPRTIVDPDRQARLGQVRSFPAKMMKVNDDSSRLIIDTSPLIYPV